MRAKMSRRRRGRPRCLYTVHMQTTSFAYVIWRWTRFRAGWLR